MAGSLTKAYERVKNIDWEPTYIAPAEKYVEPTRFHLPKKAVDPFKTVIREYFTMERENLLSVFLLIVSPNHHLECEFHDPALLSVESS